MPGQPLVRELVPAPDPWYVARILSHLPHLCFLDSSDRHPTRGRFSYVMADPETTLVRSLPKDGIYDPFWDDTFIAERLDAIPELPPFQGGWVGAFGYHLGRAFDRQPRAKTDEFGSPDQAVGLYDLVISFDHETNRAWVISTGNRHEWPFPQERLTYAQLRLDTFFDLVTGIPSEWGLYHDLETEGKSVGSAVRTIRTPPSAESITPSMYFPVRTADPTVTSNFTRNGYLAAVQKVIDYIHAGDAFQVNLSQRLLAPLTEHPLDVYGRLRKVSPSPYGCYFDAGEFQILSSSPEQFLQLSPDGTVVTRPIKGTRPRGKTPEEDEALIRDLTTNPKDRAENVMIVDLMRNDLGRVCEFGSVTVPRVCEVESYDYVHHMVSEVRGKLAPGKTAFDLLRACFPGGSVTGAPKVRAMEIIAELEPSARGPYCGSMGWVGFDGAMDSNILIRTMTAGKGWLQFPVGGGIVADSIPEREYEETLHKAAGMLRALKAR
jgi:para-aminobenzoate synthetase component 1